MALSFLSGIRVVDLGQYLPGPHAAQILADLGADVIKVESKEGDPLRRLVGTVDSDGTTAAYKLLNAGKTVIRLDLKGVAGAAAFTRLIAGADALVESFRPGALSKLGFSPERLRAINPRLVHASLSGWGYDGPYGPRAGHDMNYMALGGGLVGSGTVERPVFAFPPVADFASAQQTALAVVAALFGRSRSGQGAFLDLSIMETVLGWQGLNLTAAARGDAAPRGEGLLSGGAAFYALYPTRDGRFVTLSAIEPKFWQAFCAAVERPDWLERQGEPLPQRALMADIGDLFLSRTLAQWQALLDPADCCFEVVPEFAEVPDHPHIKARGQVVRHEGPAGGAEPLVETLLGLRVDGGPPPARTPLVDSNIADVLSRWDA